MHCAGVSARGPAFRDRRDPPAEWAAARVRNRRTQGDENAQAQDEERREEALQAHRHRQGEARCGWQAPPADQPQRQVYPPEPRHLRARRCRCRAHQGMGALRSEVRRA
ncbi:hypothetical protein QU38_02490 [Staphylococcus aureus]|uniref:Uncharacterized protein n=1 Tax=Staphylococcus aureus TaxID=1280 RepID=A0AA40MKQ0_STAAU|nr:hypothetical protein QU38_02490 [Staphylococcus aureus]